MNWSKKLVFCLGLAVSMYYIEAAQSPLNSKKNQAINQQNQQELEEQLKFLTTLSMMWQIEFMKNYPEFIKSVVDAFRKLSSDTAQNGNSDVMQELSDVTQKVISRIQSQFDAVMNVVIKTMQASMQEQGVTKKELDASMKEIQAMVKEYKPLLEQMSTEGLMQWIQVTAMSGMKIQ